MPELVPQELVSVALGPPRSAAVSREVSFKALTWRSVTPLLELMAHDIASAPTAMSAVMRNKAICQDSVEYLYFVLQDYLVLAYY